MSNWNGLDFFIFLILTLNTIRGLSRGAGKEMIALMCLSVALVFSIQFTVPLANFLYSSPAMISFAQSKIVTGFFHAFGADAFTLGFLNHLMYSISLLICFVGVFSVTEAAISYSGYAESLTITQAVVYRKIGGAIGFTRGYIITLILLSILTLHIYKDNEVSGKSLVSRSFFAKLFESQTLKLDNMIGSQEVGKYHELYKDKPYNEQEIYKSLSKPDEQQ